VVERSRTNPADPVLDGMQHRQHLVALRASVVSVGGCARFVWRALSATPTRFRSAQDGIDGRTLVGCGLRVGEMKVQSVPVVLLDADGSSFEFRGTRLRIDSFNCQVVGGYLIVKVCGKKGEPRAQPSIKAHRRYHRSASRSYQYFFSFSQLVMFAVFRR